MRCWTPSQRRWGAVLTTLAVVPAAGMITAAGSLLDNERRMVPTTYSTPYLLTAAIDESGSTVGIADSHIWELSKPDGSPDFEAMEAHLDTMLALGVDTVRVILPWRGNEPWQPGTTGFPWLEASAWQRSDFIINAAYERGMAVLGVLNHAPEWGSYYDEPYASIGLEEAPDVDLFAAYATRVAQRYGDKVSAYEIWNEPNGVTGWAPNINPELYTEVLIAAYNAIKAVNPDTLVVAGVLGAVVDSPFTMDPRKFVQRMYAAGAQGYFDALSFHPYHYSLKFGDGKYNIFEPWKANSPLEQVLAIRQLMIDNGDEALRIWASEYGLPTFGLNGVTEDQQRDYIADFLVEWAKLDFAGPAFLYTLRDAFLNGEITEATSFGLFKYDPVTGQWVAKKVVDWLMEFLADPENPTDPGTVTPPPRNIIEAIAVALQSVFEQIRATVQLFQQQFEGMINTVNAMFRAVTDAIAALFSPRSSAAAALRLPEDVREGIAAGAQMASDALSSDTPESDTTENSPVVEVSLTDQDQPAAVEGSAAEEGPAAGTEPTAGTDSTEEPVEEPAEEPVEEPADEVTDEVTDELVIDDEVIDDEESESDEADVRVGIVARPGTLGDAGDEPEDSGETTDSDDTDADEPADTEDADSETD